MSADDPEVLLEVGRAIDRFGAPYTGIEPGELDQEQHDGVRDVFYVTTAAMLVRTDLFTELEGFDPATFPGAEDLDLCWRARLAGARVLVVPDARVAHREAADERLRDRPARRVRARARSRVRVLLTSYSLLRRCSGWSRSGSSSGSSRRSATSSPGIRAAPAPPSAAGSRNLVHFRQLARVAAGGRRRCARCTTPSSASCRCRARRASARSSPTTSTPTPGCARWATRRAARSIPCPTACARRPRSRSSASSLVVVSARVS